MNEAINLEKLNVNYGDKAVIHNFNFSIPQNTFLAIVGHNGCGKSSLLRSIANLQPFSGSIKILSKELSQIPNIYKSGLMSFLSQNQQIGFDINVRELLLMGRHRFSTLFSSYSNQDFSMLDQVIKELGLERYINQNFLELSGGEQQLILFAQTILQDAKILLLDEPTQNLDIKNGYKIIQYLNYLVQEKQKTVIISTHDLHHLTNVIGNILNMSCELTAEVINPKNLQKHTELLRK